MVHITGRALALLIMVHMMQYTALYPPLCGMCRVEVMHASTKQCGRRVAHAVSAACVPSGAELLSMNAAGVVLHSQHAAPTKIARALSCCAMRKFCAKLCAHGHDAAHDSAEDSIACSTQVDATDAAGCVCRHCHSITRSAFLAARSQTGRMAVTARRVPTMASLQWCGATQRHGFLMQLSCLLAVLRCHLGSTSLSMQACVHRHSVIPSAVPAREALHISEQQLGQPVEGWHTICMHESSYCTRLAWTRWLCSRSESPIWALFDHANQDGCLQLEDSSGSTVTAWQPGETYNVVVEAYGGSPVNMWLHTTGGARLTDACRRHDSGSAAWKLAQSESAVAWRCGCGCCAAAHKPRLAPPAPLRRANDARLRIRQLAPAAGNVATV